MRDDSEMSEVFMFHARSAMASSNLLSTLIFIHRELGSNDESSSDSEQIDKILYFYPESTPIHLQLAKCNMIEGMIDFFTRFTYDDDSLENVLMDNHIWSFLRIDEHPSIWLVAAVPSQYIPETDTLKTTSNLLSSSFPLSIHSNITLSSVCPSTSLLSTLDNVLLRADSKGLRDTLIRFYDIYSLFHSTVTETIQRIDPLLSNVKRVQQLRKLSRKLFDYLQQTYLDIEAIKSRRENCSADESSIISNGVSNISTNDEESNSTQQMNISNDSHITIIKTLGELEDDIINTKKSISTYNFELENLVNEASKYVPLTLSKSIVSFSKWFLSSGEILFPSSLHRWVIICRFLLQ